MKKIIFITLFIALAYQFVLAQEKQSFKRFNYGVDASLIIFPINLFDKNTCIFGIHPTLNYNLNNRFFLQTGIGLENGRYENFENYFVNGNTENLNYIQEYLRFGIPVALGFHHNLFNNKFNLNTKIGVIYNSNLSYYDYVSVSNAPFLNHEIYPKPNLIKLLSWARLALYYSIGIEKKIVNNQSVGFSCFLLILHQNQIVHYMWQSDNVSRFQIGVKLTYKFNCNE
ncbi:MAG: hypothetical protein PHW83_12405 [Bacteroidales bacterium]|nr:hypothetical protein [Bacteroidales bacterium]